MNTIASNLNKVIDELQSCNCTTVAVAVIGLIGLIVVAKWALCLVSGILGTLTTGSKLKKYQKPGAWAGTSSTVATNGCSSTATTCEPIDSY
jgi:hypothetical protein